MFLSIFRVIKFSFQDLIRNIWLTAATVTILVLALISINLLITVRVLSQNAIAAVRDKINVSLYLKTDASDAEIAAARSSLSNLSLVQQVTYVSKQQALLDFRQKNQNNPQILQALNELDLNPLSPSLVIQPTTPDALPQLIDELKALNNPVIESRDFSDNTLILQKINNITSKVNDVGWILIVIFTFTGILVIYNSIKVAIYTHKREIEIMRLVGASNGFIYWPYLISAMTYALMATLIIITIYYTFLGLLQPYLDAFFTGSNMDLITYFVNNFWSIFGMQFLGAALVSILASWLAIRKYAKV